MYTLHIRKLAASLLIIALSGCATSPIETNSASAPIAEVKQVEPDLSEHRLPIFDNYKDKDLHTRSNYRMSTQRLTNGKRPRASSTPMFWNLLTTDPVAVENEATGITRVINHVVLGLFISQDNHYLAIEDLGDLEYQHLSIDKLPATPEGGIGIKFTIGADNTINLVGTFYREDELNQEGEFKTKRKHTRQETDRLVAQVLREVEVRYIGSLDGAEQDYEQVYSGAIKLHHRYSIRGVPTHRNEPIYLRYKSDLQAYSNQLAKLERDVKRTAYQRKIDQEETAKRVAQEERLRENERKYEVAKLARQEASRKRAAYLRSPEGKAELAAYNAKLEAIEKKKLARRKAEGWPPDAVGKVSEGALLCGDYKSGLRAYMIERSGNPYASTSAGCSYSPRSLYVSEISTMPGGVAKVFVMGGGYFYVSPSSVEG